MKKTHQSKKEKNRDKDDDDDNDDYNDDDYDKSCFLDSVKLCSVIEGETVYERVHGPLGL